MTPHSFPMHTADPRTIRVQMGCGSFPEAPAPAWYVLRTAPGIEHHVLADVVAAGFDAYLPRFVRRRMRYGRRETVVEALFPTYLLVAFTESAAWGALLRLRGVRGLLGAPGNPRPIPMPDAERIIALGVPGDNDAGAPLIAPGADVRVIDGPLTSFAGICLWSAPQRVAVLLSLFGRKVPIELDRSMVETA